MPSSSNQRLQINRELATRSSNEHAKDIIGNHMPESEKANLKIDFRCECSAPDCQERIALTLEEFARLHDDRAKFVIAKGHQTPAVEQTVDVEDNLQVVKKFALS